MKTAKKICLFSGKRGGLGAYIPLMRLIEADGDMELQILLADMHASQQFGFTADEVKSVFPHAKIEIVDMGTGRGGTPRIRAENLGELLKRVPIVLEKLGPDIIFVHADRADHLIIALAALTLNIPVAHTQGGEISGNIDDLLRHSITKLAHLHFPETPEAAKRIKLQGEEEWRVHPVGSLYIDRIVKNIYTDPLEAKRRYSLREDEKYMIVICHPETLLSEDQNYQRMKNIMSAVDSTGFRGIVTYPCSDPGYQGIIRAIKEAAKDPKCLIFKNIDNFDFLGLMKGALCLIGNSSAGFVEGPYLKIAAINVGTRQLGRDREENVIDAEGSAKSIKEAVQYALSDPDFHVILNQCGYRLGDGCASEKILDVIRNTSIDSGLFQKHLTYR